VGGALPSFLNSIYSLQNAFKFENWICTKYGSAAEYGRSWPVTIQTLEKDPGKQAALFFALFAEFFQIEWE
jgi:hypothetical protein